MSLDPEIAASLGKIGGGLVLALSATGTSLGVGAAGAAAIGAWKKCYVQNKLAPFLLFVFIGAPMSQTFYGMIVMFKICALADAGSSFPSLIGWGLGGLGIGASAWMQGKIGAAGADALAETGKGFVNYLMALGIVESVAIFVMVFTLIKAV